MDRRSFLQWSAVSLATAASTTAKAAQPGAEGGLFREMTSRPANYESPRSVLTQRLTPVDRFYARNHFDTPIVDVASWRLSIGGQVAKPLSLSLADLQAMPQTTVEAVLQCSGNGRALFQPRMPGVQWERGAVGNAEWTGVRLNDVLAKAGVAPSARYVQVQGAERPVLPKTPAFIRGIPLTKAMHGDTIIALHMNGQPLPRQHGAPARLVVPGWVADDWIKWLTTIELLDGEPKGFWYETAYRFPDAPGTPGAPVAPEHMKVMTAMNVKSVIGSIEHGAVLAPGPVEIVGVAWSGDGHAITKVEVSVDGTTWQRATLDGAASKYGFRVFRSTWRAPPGPAVLRARATDDSGAAQPDAPVWNPSGYLWNAIDPVTVEVRS